MKPILFSTDMVKAILEDRKTQTRRVVKPQPKTIYWDFSSFGGYWDSEKNGNRVESQYQPGDILWVRETWAHSGLNHIFIYKADNEKLSVKWRPSIHMPREAARIFLRITGVRLERLQEIDDAGATTEGTRDSCMPDNIYWKNGMMRACFATLWDSIYGDMYSWDSNPWVWVYEFERVQK